MFDDNAQEIFACHEQAEDKFTNVGNVLPKLLES